MRIPQQQQKQQEESKQQQQAAYTQQQRPGFDVDTKKSNNTIFPSCEPYELHRTPRKKEQTIMSLPHPFHGTSFHRDHDTGDDGQEEDEGYAASSVTAAASSSQVTDTICDSESYLAIHEMTLNNNNNNSSQQQQYRNHNNSTRETISLNDSNEQQQQQQQQQQPDMATATPIATDATQVVHEMHLALLYLLSNPEEFQRALAICQSSAHDGDDERSHQQAKTLQEWNNEDPLHNIDNESLLTEHTTDWHHQQKSKNKNDNAEASDAADAAGTPLPFVVFANDAEVVLPQAHTASQLFGLERISGIELEAAAGLPALCQLFLRWLAIMPAGDHLNLIDPPGLTIMRIAGGRYRVTAAHRVVWTWMNEFVPLEQELTLQQKQSLLVPVVVYNNKPTAAAATDVATTSKLNSAPSPSPPPPLLGGEPIHQLQVGDLVTMTIVDVFETDNQGKLLSYCPTFDNRAVFKTHVTTETLRKSTTQALHLLGQARQSKLAHMVMRQAKRVANNFQQFAITRLQQNNQNQNSQQQQQQQQQHYRGSPSQLTPPTHAVDLNLDVDHDDYDNFYQDDGQEDDTSKALMEFRAAVAAEENGSAMYAASSTYLADDDLERHEV